MEGLTTLDLQKASDVASGKEGGSNIAVPIAGTLGEASAMFGLGEAVRLTKEHITKVVDTAKASKVRARDSEAFQDFTENISQDHPPVQVPTEKIGEVFERSGKTPEEVLNDPVSYYESKLKGDTKVDLPVSEVTKLADDIKPTDIDSMTMNDLPSVNELKAAKETAMVKEKAAAEKAKATEPGEMSESQLAKRAEADAIEKKLTEDLGDLSQYKTESMKTWADDAQKILDADYNKAKRIAMGTELPPEGVHVASVYEAVKIRALQEGDIKTIQNLATESTVPTRLSELGQEIKAADSRIQNDPIRDAQIVVKDRKEKAARTGKQASTEKEVKASGEKAKKAAKKFVKNREKAAKEKLKEFIKDHQDEIGKRQTRKTIRKVNMESLNKEFKGLSAELNKILSPNKLTAGIDPTAIPVLIKMAKNRIEAGIITVEGLVDSIHFEIKDLVEGVTKREVRDAISGYGKTTKPNPEAVATKLRELKAQSRLISALEDAEKGQPPLRSGFQRDAVSDEVRSLQKQVQEEMRKSGIKTTSPEQQMKTALDAVKTRLKNQITDLTKQIETGQKTPKKTGIKYDEEANALKDTRDLLRKAIEDVEGKPKMTDEQRIKVATEAVKRSIAEYERRIKAKELIPPKKGSNTPETPELKALRTIRDSLKDQYKKMQDDAKPPKDPEAIRLKTFKTRVTNEIAKLEARVKKGDFEKPERKSTILDAEGQKLKEAYDVAREDYKNLSESYNKITKEEIGELVRLSKATEQARKNMEQGGDRLAYGAARVKYINYVDSLKGAGTPIGELVKDRVGELKTTFKDNKAKAVFDVAKDTLRTITDNSIGLVATLDNSFLGRQGLKTLMTHPSAWYPAAKNSFVDFAKTLGGKASMDALKADIFSRPNFIDEKYQKAKIIAKTEEQFPTTLPERVPGVGRVFKASENAFVGSGLRMRADLFDLLERNAKVNGINTSDAKWLVDVGRLTNSLTARGQWGERGGNSVVRLILWAPKMLKANLDVLTMHGLGAGFNTPWARKQAAANLLKIVGETATIMMIANAILPGSAETDPTSTDFGKIKIGKTRFDITGGAASLVVLSARLITNSTKSTTSGLKTQYGLEYGGASRLTVLEDFLINKTTPSANVLTQWMRGETREGDEFTWAAGAYSGFTPISLQNFIELKDDLSVDAVAGAIVDIIGINAMTYKDTGNQPRYIISRFRDNKPLTDDQQKTYDKMTDSQQRYVHKEAAMTAMQAAFSHLSIENKVYAWSKANNKEREELSDLYSDAVDSHMKNNIVDIDEQNKFEQLVDDAEIRK